MEVAQVGMRTRDRALAKAAAASSGTAKRRKISGEAKFSSSLVQLGICRTAAVTPENSVSPATSENSASKDRCSSRSSDHVPVSCCSSNASSDLAKTFEIVDLEDDSVHMETQACKFGCRERREKTPSSEMQSESGEVESTARPSEVTSCRKLPAEEKKPSVMELEEFFAAAEKDRQKRFAEKYNFDIVKDAPMEGRYEWVQLKP